MYLKTNAKMYTYYAYKKIKLLFFYENEKYKSLF